MLGDRVRRVADLGEQAGGRRGVEQVAAAPLDHAWHQEPGGLHVGHDVDVPHAVPRLVGGLDALGDADAGVGGEQVDRPDLGLGALDDRGEVALVADVGGDVERRRARAVRRRPGSPPGRGRRRSRPPRPRRGSARASA